jgi:two-component sensor histidine kinase
MINLNGKASAAARTLAAAPARQAAEAIHRAPNRDIPAAIDVGGYLEAIAARIISARPTAGEILLRVDLPARLVLPLGKAVALLLIVGELVTNAIQYAHPTGVLGVIGIKSFRHNGAIVVEISDDGVGLPEGLDPLAPDNAGLVMVRALAARLQASISFDDHGLGLSCALAIPYIRAAL